MQSLLESDPGVNYHTFLNSPSQFVNPTAAAMDFTSKLPSQINTAVASEHAS